MGGWYRSDAEDAERIGAVILSDDVSDDDCTDDGTECDGYYVERRECDSECIEDHRSDDYCCTEVAATDNGYHWKGQDEVG
jgi:hypothetical protein